MKPVLVGIRPNNVFGYEFELSSNSKYVCGADNKDIGT